MNFNCNDYLEIFRYEHNRGFIHDRDDLCRVRKEGCTSVRNALLLLLCEVLLSYIIPVLSTALVLASATTEKKKILLKPVDSHSVPTIFWGSKLQKLK